MKISNIQPELIRQIIDTFAQNHLLTIPIGLSNRHLHLCRRDVDILFGPGYELQIYRELSQKGYYAAKETVVVAGPAGAISNVRVLGPLRGHTQLELMLSDQNKLGVKIPLNHSGILSKSDPVTIIGPKGTIVNHTGVMAALRHIHMNTAEAVLLELKDGDEVAVICGQQRRVRFERVKIRTGDFVTELHLDFDEANGAGLKNGDKATILLQKE